MIVNECANCGGLLDTKSKQSWGRTKESDGYGPLAKCVGMVPNPYAPRTRGGEVPLQVCGGDLVARVASQDEVSRVASHTLR